MKGISLIRSKKTRRLPTKLVHLVIEIPNELGNRRLILVERFENQVDRVLSRSRRRKHETIRSNQIDQPARVVETHMVPLIFPAQFLGQS